MAMKSTAAQKILIGLAAVLAVLLCIGIFTRHKEPVQEAEPEPAVTEEPVIVPEETPEPPKEYELTAEELEQLRNELKEDQAVNSDVVCLIHFKSGLVHAPVLQSQDVNYYLYRDWKTHEYLSYGSIVLDPVNDLKQDEKNTILYGHYIYESRNPDRTLVFTPLAQLMRKEEYEGNKYLCLITEDEVRYYETAAVFDCPLETYEGAQYTIYGLEYNLPYYTKEYIELYRKNIAEHEYYPTGVAFDENDYLLTLQTCIEGVPESREIVVCRELERRPVIEE